MIEKGRAEAAARAHSFKHAFAGCRYVIRTQHNTWVHGTVTAIVFALAVWLRLSLLEWAILVLTAMIVWIAEFLNTAIEAVVDLAMADVHPLAKVAKDVAAAAVLLGAIGSVSIGLLVLGPPLYSRIIG